MELLFAPGEEGSLHSALFWALISFPAVPELAEWTLADVVGHEAPKACMGRITSPQPTGTGVLAVKESHQQMNCFSWHFWSCRRQQQGWGALLPLQGSH